MELQLWISLEFVGLGQYLNVLNKNGYTSWKRLTTITEADMARLGLKLGHRRRLQRAIASMKGYSMRLPLEHCGFTNRIVDSQFGELKTALAEGSIFTCSEITSPSLSPSSSAFGDVTATGMGDITPSEPEERGRKRLIRAKDR